MQDTGRRNREEGNECGLCNVTRHSQVRGAGSVFPYPGICKEAKAKACQLFREYKCQDNTFEAVLLSWTHVAQARQELAEE